MRIRNVSAIVIAMLLSLIAPGSTPDTYAQSQPGATSQRNSVDDGLDVVLRNLVQEIRALRADVKDLRAEMKRTRARPAVAAAAPARARARRDPNRTWDIALHASDRRMGNEKAKYALIEFSDFQCPFCSRFHGDAYPKIVENYVDTGKVQYVFRDFPLGFHRKARGAHIAARCAGDQGQFWAMHHALFSNQKTLGTPLYTRTAGELKLDEDAFKRCTADAAVGAAMDKEIAAGRNYGVRGTPTFYVGEIRDGKIVNAKQLSGAQPFAKFAQYIDAALGTQTATQ